MTRLERPRNESLSQPWELWAAATPESIHHMLLRLRHVWGGQLARGYTRFIEDIRPGDDEQQQLAFYGRPFGNSLCHAWSGAAAVIALARGVAGIRVRGSFATVQPLLGDLAWLHARVPVGAGALTVHANEKTCTVELPAGVTVRIAGSVHQGPASIDFSLATR